MSALVIDDIPGMSRKAVTALGQGEVAGLSQDHIKEYSSMPRGGDATICSTA
jgi:hypothetical protein